MTPQKVLKPQKALMEVSPLYLAYVKGEAFREGEGGQDLLKLKIGGTSTLRKGACILPPLRPNISAPSEPSRRRDQKFIL